MSGLKVSLLGAPRLERDGVSLELRPRKNIALVAYLAVTGQSHSREALITLLWPELEPSRARAGLRRNLSMLRKALGEAWLVVDRESVGLKPRVGFWLDVDRFRSLLRAWQTHDHPQPEPCSACLTALAEAVELYRGDFLEGFSLRDSANFDEWQFFQTEGLRQELASALERLVHGHSAQGAYASAIPYARRWLALDPLRESTHRQLMTLYAQADQQAAAIRQYQECVRLLEQELGLPPSEETTALYEQIRTRSVEPEEQPFHSPLLRHNLPAQATPFVGRQTALAQIKARLSGPDCRLLTLIGPGGMGKTRLALQVAADLVTEARRDLWEHGLFLVSLAPLQTADAIVPAVAKALGFSFYEGPTPQQQLLDYVRQRRMLLILDNFEHLLAPPPSVPPSGGDERGGELVSALLKAAPGLKILATSRARLKVQGEHLFHLGGLRFPEPTPPSAEIQQEIADYSAVELFLQSARRVDPGLEPSADDLRSIAHICRLVQGMPLGILLAAGWVELLSPSEIAAEINQSLDFLEADLHDLPNRQRSIRAVFDHSWNLLSARQRTLMQAVSVFRDEFTRQAAQEVADASLHDLLALASRSLLYRTQEGRYEVHELLRQYAAEKLEQLPTTRDTVRDRHSAYYTAALQSLESNLKGAQQQVAMAQIDQQLDDMRAAWDWATERGHVEGLDQATESLALFFRWRSRQREGQAVFRHAAERLSTLLSRSAAPSDTGPVVAQSTAQGSRVLARLWAWQYRLGGWLDEPEGRVLQQSLDLLERAELAGHDTRAEKAFVLQQMGYSLAGRDPEGAEALCRQSLALYQALHDRYGMAEVLDVLGMIAARANAYHRAKELYEESLALRQVQGDRKGSARSLMWLSEIAVPQGQIEESVRLAQDSIAICREIGDQGGIVLGLNNLSATLGLLGRFAEAHALMEGSPAILNNLGFNTGYAHGLLGWINTQLGRYDQARVLGRAMLDLAQEMGLPWHIGLSYWGLGCVALAAEAYAEAQGLLRESVAIFREIGHQGLQSQALASLGYAARGLGQLPQAREHVREALQTAAEIGFLETSLTPALALPMLALLLADKGEKERAVELYAVASRHPFVANSRWIKDISGKHIAAVATTLPPDVVAAAQERGRARDLQATMAELLEELAAQE